MVLLRDCKLPDILRLLGEIQDGNHLNDESVVYLRGEEFKITLTNGKCDRPDIDGDEGPDFPLCVKCMKGALKLLI